MPDLKNVEEYVKALEHMLQFFRQLLEEKDNADPLSELTDLRLLARDKKWPEAIDPDLISGDSEEEKINRAEGIIVDFMKADLQGQRFLDYGCGEGYVASQAIEHGASLSIGYDIVCPHSDWHPKNPNLVFLDKLTIEDFDVVLMNDVLDHTSDPVSELKKAKSAKKKDAKIHLRCHPWTSRHATHLYRKLNKAYLHLVFTENELRTLGLKGEETTKLLYPIKSYKEWFEKAQLEIVQESTITRPVDAFFTTQPAIARRIKDHWSEGAGLDTVKFPHEQLMIQFADFVLV